MKVWMPMDCIDALKECAELRRLSLNQVVYGSLGSPVMVWGGKKYFLNLNLPTELISHKVSPLGISPYLHVDLQEYTKYTPRSVMNTISKWPKMSDRRHYTKMKEVFADSHPALWNVQVASKTGNFTECLIRFGAFDFRPYLKSSKDKAREVLNSHTHEELVHKLMSRLEPADILQLLQ